jgi:hypothetical protein
MRDSMTDTLLKHGAVLVQRLRAAAEKGVAIDMQDMFFRFTMDSFSEIAFGEDLGCLTSEQPHPFSKAFDSGQSVRCAPAAVRR